MDTTLPGKTAGIRDFLRREDLALGIVGGEPSLGNQPVLAPGDPQRTHERERRRDGIALDARTADVLTALATNHGLPGPTVAIATDEEIAS